MRNITFAIVTLVVAAACSTNPAAKSAAVGHSDAIRSVALGQTMFEVHELMKSSPETRTRRVLADGRNQEEWGYVTDYGNDVITLITFTDRKVTEIRPMAWRGEFVKDAIAPGEDLRSDVDLSRENESKKAIQSNIDNAEDIVKIGISASEARRLLGAPLEARVHETSRGVSVFVEQTFRRSDGGKLVVSIQNDKVTGVSRQR